MDADSDDVAIYSKIPFEWTEALTLSEEIECHDMSWTSAEKDEGFLEVVAASLAVSLDTLDRARVASWGAIETARHLLASVPEWRCSRDSDWWKMLNYRGEAVGFVLPVTYDDVVRGGRRLGTIFHIGVLPAFRGHGYGRILLREATRTLMDSGAYRIFCDTDIANAPMIHLFQSEGWTQLPNREAPLFKS